ncbi:hypothetical protein LZ575_07300 [Antarcticibacterium sp. 1MA-6-2]|uniref:DinB family protein n=1 Tax=Antarcticibacterium sp. 1MA-6-2 TaxID=2908210 RepID=UPI001F170114|nr:DinB family protein [Antarcticibacterium sp. 1MA-6-2]UJH92328.1 hypothetical protein LZ575_07300 [Antarcticibacterium sp. 1MA-6-2]
MKEQFREWYSYNSEANLKVIQNLTELKEIPDRAIDIFSHLLLAHKIWLERIDFRDTISGKPWEKISSEEFLAINKWNLEFTLEVLKEQELNKRISYTNSKGVNFNNSIEEILFHVLTHSSYHRGQVAILLRQENFDPPLTDYIFYKR